MEIRKLLNSEKKGALDLVWHVFLKFEAPDYCDQGVVTFRDFLENEEAINGLSFFGTFENGVLIGVIATRNEGSHIALFFVSEKYQHQGIGKKLFKEATKNTLSERITVNSSPYAVQIYHHLGFTATDTEQIRDGIRFIPMMFTRRVILDIGKINK